MDTAMPIEHRIVIYDPNTIVIRSPSNIAIRNYLDQYPMCCCNEIANNTGVGLDTVKMQLRHWVASRHVVREKKISCVTGRRCYHYRLSTQRKIEVV